MQAVVCKPGCYADRDGLPSDTRDLSTTKRKVKL
jgi:hypothetical protein